MEVASTNYYYYGGTFYVLSGNSYVVVEAPIGAVVKELPEGAEEIDVSGNLVAQAVAIRINNRYISNE